MRKYPTDYRLWAILTGVIFGGMWIAVLVHSPDLPNKLAREFGQGTRKAFATAGDLASVGLVYLGIAALVGWVIQAVAVVCGFRRTRRPDPPQAADYDDKPPPPTD
jgi:hypothetical protein